MRIKAKRLSDTAKLPTYGSECAACADLYANLRVDAVKAMNSIDIIDTDIDVNTREYNIISIPPHATIKIPTGWAFQPIEGYAGFIYARSGLSTKQGLRPANCLGVCDEDYTAEYIVPLHNDTDEYQVVHNGDRIAQLEFRPYSQARFVEVGELDKTARGAGGFGSTGA